MLKGKENTVRYLPKPRRGFTLHEIMIVLMVMTMLFGIAMPQLISSRKRSKARACTANLKRIADAKDQFAMENSLPEGSPVANTDLWPVYIRADVFPACPAGGTYTLGVTGETPTCSKGADDPPHALP